MDLTVVFRFGRRKITPQTGRFVSKKFTQQKLPCFKINPLVGDIGCIIFVSRFVDNPVGSIYIIIYIEIFDGHMVIHTIYLVEF